MPPPLLVGWRYTAGAITHECLSLTRRCTRTPSGDGSQNTSTSLNRPHEMSRDLIASTFSGFHSSPVSICAISSTVSVVVLVLPSTTISSISSADARAASTATIASGSTTRCTKKLWHSRRMNPAEVATALLIERTLQDSPAYRKIDDSLYVIKQGSAYVMISVVPWGDNRAMVRCASQLVKGIDVDGPLAKQLLELNRHIRFGAFAVDPAEHTVLFTHTILGGHTLDPEELVATLRDVALIADEYDDKLMKKYGGQRMIDLLEEAAMERIMERNPDDFQFDD